MRHALHLIAAATTAALCGALGCGSDNINDADPSFDLYDDAQPDSALPEVAPPDDEPPPVPYFDCRANARISQMPELLARHPGLKFIEVGDLRSRGCLFYEERSERITSHWLPLTLAELCPDDWAHASRLHSFNEAFTRFSYGVACAERPELLAGVEARFGEELGDGQRVEVTSFEGRDAPLALNFYGHASMLAPDPSLNWTHIQVPTWQALSALRIEPTLTMREVGAAPEAPWLKLYDDLPPLLESGDHRLCDISRCGFDQPASCITPSPSVASRNNLDNAPFFTDRAIVFPEGAVNHRPNYQTHLQYHARLTSDEAGERCVSYEPLAQGVYEVKVCVSHQQCSLPMRALYPDLAADDPRAAQTIPYNRDTRCMQRRFVRLGQDDNLLIGFDEGEEVGAPRQCVP